MDRQHFTPLDSITYLWKTLRLPDDALKSIDLIHNGDFLPSSFKTDHLAHATIAASALAAALFRSTRLNIPLPKVSVPVDHACAEFMSERLYVLDGKPAPTSWTTIGGLHKTSDGHVRMHDGFPHHRENALAILGLDEDVTRNDVGKRMLQWKSVELESEAFRRGAVIVGLRSFEEWDQLPQAQAIADFPVRLTKKRDGEPYFPEGSSPKDIKCRNGLRVVEMSRVIAAPVAGKTLAAHGADVIWITSSTLPDLPDVDIDVARGKRTVQLDIKQPKDRAKLLELIRTADVFIQGYRPESLAAQGLSTEELIKMNPNLVVANLSAWGPDGPWSSYRGFDSLVQTCSGLNVADAERFGGGEAARVLPCQALDHGAGYLLATGIMAALYKRGVDGGAYEVDVSLAGVMKYLRSLGRYEGKTGFDRMSPLDFDDVEKFRETRMTGFGELSSIRHSASIEGVEVGWEIMPKALGSDEATWLDHEG